MAVALFFYGGGRTLREALLSNFITDQYDIGKLEEVIKVFLELIDTAVLKLADEDYYIKITQNYEMKFTGGKYAITKTDEEDFLNKIEAFAASKMHNKTHSIQLVMITTMGIARGEHASIVNQSVVLDDLFADR